MSNPTEKPEHANPIQHPSGPVLPEFKTHRLNELGMEKSVAIRTAMSAALQVVENCLPQPSRERSIVVTKLQEASMFAILAVSMDAVNQAEPQ